jgi:hypothetical protein
VVMQAQVSTRVPEIRRGRIVLPAEADLSGLVDWGAVRQLAYNI